MRYLSLPQALAALALLVFSAQARAEDPPPPVPKAAATTIFPAPGASPGGAARPAPRPRRRVKADQVVAPGTPIATYPSFRLLDDGTSRVTLEVARKVAVTEHKAKGRVVYSFAGAAVPGSNTRLALPTGFFHTPVERVEAVSRGDGVDLVIELREDVPSTYRIVETPRGSSVLQVDFARPAGDAEGAAVDTAKRPSETKRLEQKPATDD
ncbi:MAG: AMIN domain-containing protein [Byssovorax sp.]